MRVRPEKMLEYIDCPQFGSKDGHYGEWGALRFDQRLAIKELCDYTISIEKIVDDLRRSGNMKIEYVNIDDIELLSEDDLGI